MKIYLAIPYTGMEDNSFRIANIAAGAIMELGHIVFSPISMSHPIAKENELPGGWEFWRKIDESFIDWCDEVHVVCVEGWQSSKGIIAEIAIAKTLKKAVRFINVLDNNQGMQITPDNITTS